MKIIHDDAASVLLERLNSVRGWSSKSWRCIHIHLSDKPERYNHGLRAHFVARVVIDRLHDMDGYLFLCDDGDIFLLFQGLLKPVLANLNEHFDDIADIDTAGEKDARFTVYDLSIDWNIMHAMAYTKKAKMEIAPEGFYERFAYSMEEIRA